MIKVTIGFILLIIGLVLCTLAFLVFIPILISFSIITLILCLPLILVVYGATLLE